MDLLRQVDAVAEHLGTTSASANVGLGKFAGTVEQLRAGRYTGGLPGLLDMGDPSGNIHRYVEAVRRTKDQAQALKEVLADAQKIDSIQQRKTFLEAFGMDPAFANFKDKMLDNAKTDLGPMPKGALENATALKEAFDRVGDSVNKIKTDIENSISEPLRKSLNLLRGFMHDHEAATIGLSAAAGGYGVYKVVGAVRRILGGSAAILSPGLLGGVVGALGPGGFAAAGLLATAGGLNADEDERDRQRKYMSGLGRGQRALMNRGGFHPISGAFADIAQNFRGEESLYKNVLRGTREGVLQAFQQFERDREGGGIISAAYHPGGASVAPVAGLVALVAAVAPRTMEAPLWAARTRMSMPGSGLFSAAM